jgi:hypothetical protein
MTEEGSTVRHPTLAKDRIGADMMISARSAHFTAFKKTSADFAIKTEVCAGYIRCHRLVRDTLRCFSPLSVRSFMILVAIFSVIVLLLCFLCYSGDCNN